MTKLNVTIYIIHLQKTEFDVTSAKMNLTIGLNVVTCARMNLQTVELNMKIYTIDLRKTELNAITIYSVIALQMLNRM